GAPAQILQTNRNRPAIFRTAPPNLDRTGRFQRIHHQQEKRLIPMKKNISINLLGMIFHIEEDGYEVLRNYLDSIKIYFSGYAGHQEIVADIESRMAEIFFANLSPAKQVITLEDVQALIKKMGNVNDFAQHDQN